jgi:3-dehydroquinate dehydratase-2
MAKKIWIINGPNLNLIGKRQIDIYGIDSMDAFVERLINSNPDVDLKYFQSNVEGEIINQLHEVGFNADGIVLNAGGYSHTSIAIADAVKAIEAPVIGVHISNTMAREAERHTDLYAAACEGQIIGLGLAGYSLAISFLLNKYR